MKKLDSSYYLKGLGTGRPPLGKYMPPLALFMRLWSTGNCKKKYLHNYITVNSFLQPLPCRSNVDSSPIGGTPWKNRQERPQSIAPQGVSLLLPPAREKLQGRKNKTWKEIIIRFINNI
ncbi:MAG: hypothetical protein LUG57_00075, partial [Oscillospiraceae bacterium]|nr:hypothetical protein [Oscillospiraceae bacterium]